MKLLRALALAASTLTVVRMPVRGVGAEELRQSTIWYPLVGAGVALAPALLLLTPLPAGPRAALALAAWVAVTGALHLDGWGDCCDAAFAPLPRDGEARARRLAILKDPHLGTFAAAGLVLLLLTKWAALAELPPAAPLLAAPVGRWSMVWTLARHPAARPSGLAASLAGGARLHGATAVLTATLALTLTLVAPRELWLSGVAAVAVAGLAGMATAALFARRFGGITGDVCGASGEIAELVALCALLPWSVR